MDPKAEYRLVLHRSYEFSIEDNVDCIIYVHDELLK